MSATSKQWLVVVLPALVLGALGAPAVLLVLGVYMPAGFLDLSQSSTETLATYFFTAWIVSAALTVLVGALCWRILHSKGVDGFASYVAIAIIVAGTMSLLTAAKLPSLTLVAMALVNGFLVRLIELGLGAVVGRGLNAPVP